MRPPLKTVVALLEAADLPASDLTERHLEHFIACGPEHSPTGFVGLEIWGSNALLRSLVVSPSERSKGTGSSLVAQIEKYAREQGVRCVYLLTTTAEPLFRRLGYRRVDRSAAPDSIRSTAEFASICPASSAFMTKEL